jgi:hypothetical protein
MFAKQIQPFEAASRGNDMIPVTRQHGLKQIAIHLVIIDD